MNEKEKAQDLVLSFHNQMPIRTKGIHFKSLVKEDQDVSIRCAIVHVELMVKEFENMEYNHGIDNKIGDDIHYWLEVKKELVELSRKPIPSFI